MSFCSSQILSPLPPKHAKPSRTSAKKAPVSLDNATLARASLNQIIAADITDPLQMAQIVREKSVTSHLRLHFIWSDLMLYPFLCKILLIKGCHQFFNSFYFAIYFYSYLDCSKKIGFLYLTPRVTRSSNDYSPYNLRIVNHDAINQDDYSSISIRGVTRVYRGETDFTELDRWEQEYR